MKMVTRFYEDVVSLTDLKANPGIVEHTAETGRPILLTRRGRGVAVVQSVAGYESSAEERAFMRAAIAGLADIEAGREVSWNEAKTRLGLATSRVCRQ